MVDVIVFGIPMTIRILFRNRNTVYYIPHVGIGDYCEALSCLREYKAYHKIKHVTVIATESRQELLNFYSGYDDVLILPKHSFIGLVFLGSLPIGRYIHLRCRRIENVSYTLYMKKSLLQRNPALHVSECTKIILKIPSCSEPESPVVPFVDIEPLIQKYNLLKSKTILLNPFTGGGGGVQELDSSFYTALAKTLDQCGYRVITILGNCKQRPIENTDGIVTSLAEAWYLAKWCGWIIGTRSGFFDFIQHSGCKLIALYNEGYQQQEFFSLRTHSENVHILEYTYESNEKELINKIVESVLQHK